MMVFFGTMDPFILKLVLSFFVGGGYVVFSTIMAEKFGSKIGGFIAGLPSTVAFSLFFIAWSQGSEVAVAAAPVVPAMVGASILFVLVYIHLLRNNIFLALFGSLLVWFLSGLILLWVKFDNIYLSILLFLAAWIFFIIAIKAIPTKSIAVPFSFGGMGLKFMMAGGAVAVAVFLSKALSPLWGGLFAGFPAVFLSTMLMLTYLRPDFAIAVGKAIPLGTLATVLYPLLVHLLYPSLGFILGTIVAYGCSVVFAIIVQKPLSGWVMSW